MRLLDAAPRNLFFTGKGGVGKTSVACATALGLAARGRRTLLVSTDPASNLDETLGVALGPAPREIPGAPGLSALNIDPVAAAAAYCERMVAPYRGVLPPAALRSMEEQFSGACTVEIAAFDAFAGLLGGDGAAAFDHVVFDTAPTGHTLRLLHLPAAWSGFLEGNAGGVSCLGPLAGLAAQAALYAATQRALADPASTCVVLVARAEKSALKEAERTRGELAEAGVRRMELVVNARFAATDRSDPLAVALERREAAAAAALPAGLAALPRTTFPLLADDTVGLDRLRALLAAADVPPAATPIVGGSVATDRFDPALWPSLEALLPALAAGGSGVVMTMGKGGVGKTSIAVRLARLLHAAGHRVRLTTTDPAAHVVDALGVAPEGLIVDRIDPAVETRAYAAEILAAAGADLDAAGRALLEEDLRSPCTEEIAVFRAFARVVAAGREGFVVVDTAPTGHTLLLLDAAESYHREVSRTAGRAPPEVRELLPRLRDPAFTKIALVALPEATPVHEAAALQRDLARAGIRPFAWIVNRSYAPLRPTDPVLARRRASEFRYLDEVRALADRVALVPWSAEEPAPRP